MKNYIDLFLAPGPRTKRDIAIFIRTLKLVQKYETDAMDEDIQDGIQAMLLARARPFTLHYYVRRAIREREELEAKIRHREEAKGPRAAGLRKLDLRGVVGLVPESHPQRSSDKGGSSRAGKD